MWCILSTNLLKRFFIHLGYPAPYVILFKETLLVSCYLQADVFEAQNMSVLEFIIPNMMYPTTDPRYKRLDDLSIRSI